MSKSKYWLITICSCLTILMVFICGYILGPKIFKSSTSNPSNKFDYDVIGSGDEVLNRQWRELQLGMTKSEVESTLDSISEFFSYEKSEDFPRTQVLELIDPDNGFQEYVPTLIYFYNNKIVMIESFTNMPINGRNKIVMNNLRSKYQNLERVYYSNDETPVDKIKSHDKRINIPEFFPEWAHDRMYKLRDGHTIINIFDAQDLGVCVLMYDRLSRYTEDMDSIRQNRL